MWTVAKLGLCFAQFRVSGDIVRALRDCDNSQAVELHELSSTGASPCLWCCLGPDLCSLMSKTGTCASLNICESTLTLPHRCQACEDLGRFLRTVPPSLQRGRQHPLQLLITAGRFALRSPSSPNRWPNHCWPVRWRKGRRTEASPLREPTSPATALGQFTKRWQGRANSRLPFCSAGCAIAELQDGPPSRANFSHLMRHCYAAYTASACLVFYTDRLDNRTSQASNFMNHTGACTLSCSSCAEECCSVSSVAFWCQISRIQLFVCQEEVWRMLKLLPQDLQYSCSRSMWLPSTRAQSLQILLPVAKNLEGDRTPSIWY